MKKAFYISSMLIFLACSGPVPKEILTPDKMQKTVYEIMQVDEYINTFVAKDSSVNLKSKRSIFYEQVFKFNNTTRNEFYISLKYYEQHPEIQKILFDSINAEANRKKVEMPKVAPAKPLNKS